MFYDLLKFTSLIFFSDMVVEIKCPATKEVPTKPKPYYIQQMYSQSACYTPHASVHVTDVRIVISHSCTFLAE